MNKLNLSVFCVTMSLLISFNNSSGFCYAKSYNPTKSRVDISNKAYSAQITRTYTQVENLIEQGNFTEAKNVCEQLLKQNPNNTDAKIIMASALSAQYKLDAAQKELMNILKKDPNNANAHNELGNIYYRRTTSSNMDIRNNINQYYKAALREYEKAIELSPNLYKAYNNAGKILQEMGKIDQAEKYYKDALSIEPKYSEAVENIGSILYQKNQIESAIEKYKEAIELNSKNTSAYYRLGEALIAKGDYGKAIKHLQTSLYLFPNSAPVHYMLGKAYELQGNEAAAITSYKKSFLIKPEFLPPYVSISNIYQDRGDGELAISELRNILTINPDFMEAKLKIADISLNLNKIDQAIRYYREIMGNKAYTEPALKGLAKAYYMKAQEAGKNATMISESEYADAEEALHQAIQFDPNDLQLYLALLRVSRLSNKDAQSQEFMSKIISKPISNPIDHVVKGEAYITYNKYRDAQNEFRKALSQVNRPEDLLYLGEIFIINRQYEPAREAFNRVLASQPNNLKARRSMERIKRNEDQAIAKYNIAYGFYDDGQKAAAIEALIDCLSMNPNLPEAQLLLAKSFEKEKYYSNALDHYNAYVNLANIKYEDIQKYNRKISKLKNKVQRIKASGKEVKKFTRI